jgi:TP901 family phage tail tape measure protein
MAVANLLVKIGSDISQFQDGMSKVGQTLKQQGQQLRSLGMSLTATITAPLMGIGVASFKASTDFNKAMANVSTLIPGQEEKIESYKDTVQDLSMSLGKSTEDLAGGLYQVISAFGDTGDAMSILEINSKAAVAGLSTVEEAVNLTSAVTKAYGDVSADAVQKVADLALQTVVLGQTTFPELANAIGRVTPLAEAFNLSQEEMFGTFATLTGVTGDTNKVATQFAGILNALTKPTEEMAFQMQQLAYEMIDQGKISGEAAAKLDEYAQRSQELSAAMKEAEAAGDTATVKQLKKAWDDNAESQRNYAASLTASIIEMEGFQETLQMLTASAGDNLIELGKLIPQMEAMPAALALLGPQAETWAEKTAAMSDATGATTTAFAEQTEGINATGQAWNELQAKFKNIAQDLGDVLIPAFNDLMDAMEPLIGAIRNIIKWFSELDPVKQKMVLWGLGISAAVGPALGAFGHFEKLIGDVAGALGSSGVLKKALASVPGMVTKIGSTFKNVGSSIWAMISSPAGIWVLAIGGIIAAVTWIITHWEELTEFFSNLWEGISETFSTAWEGIKGALSTVWDGIKNTAGSVWDGVKNTVNNVWAGVESNMKTTWAGIKAALRGDWDEVHDIAKESWDKVATAISDVWAAIRSTAETAWNGITEFLSGIWDGIWDTAKEVWGKIAGFFSGVWNFITGKGQELPEGLTKEAVEAAAAQVDTADWQSDVQGDFSLPEPEGDFGTQSLNNFSNDLNDLAASIGGQKSIILNADIHDNKISDDYDIDRIGDRLVRRLQIVGVAK